jgi:hypothetical protein
MRKLGLVVGILAGAIGFGAALSGTAQAAPVSAAIGDAAVTLNIVDQAAYVYGGHSHCWYRSGWKGPGWYWCGYRWRRGHGWGGPRGWNGWVYSGWGPVVVAPAPVVVVPRRYYWGGRYYGHRRWHGGRWVYY